jgi:hypothetical protein
MATQVTVVIHDPTGRPGAWWLKLLSMVADRYDSVIVEDDVESDV